MLSADPTKVSQRAKKRGLPQVARCLYFLYRIPAIQCLPLSVQERIDCAAEISSPVQMGTLGAGNHYAEIQVIDKVFDDAAARKMGIDQEGQVGTSGACSCACRAFLRCSCALHFTYRHILTGLCSYQCQDRCYFSILADSNFSQGVRAAGVHHDPQRQPRVRPPGGHGCADVHGARHGPRQHPDQRPAAGLCPHQLTGLVLLELNPA